MLYNIIKHLTKSIMGIITVNFISINKMDAIFLFDNTTIVFYYIDKFKIIKPQQQQKKRVEKW